MSGSSALASLNNETKSNKCIKITKIHERFLKYDDALSYIMTNTTVKHNRKNIKQIYLNRVLSNREKSGNLVDRKFDLRSGKKF